jgi:ABC-type antimicrobial peptide transport system permease subunit
MSMGAAFGLFAVFSMLRYRTESLDITEMTYLFLSIAFGLLNAMISANWYEILLIDILILGFVIIFESKWVATHESSKKIIYDRLDLLAKADKTDLLYDLSSRTGYAIKKVDVVSMDLLKDVAILVVYFRE